jgi:hypothetical protein
MCGPMVTLKCLEQCGMGIDIDEYIGYYTSCGLNLYKLHVCW